MQGQGRRVVRQMRATRRRGRAARTRGAGRRPRLRLAGVSLDGDAAAPRADRTLVFPFISYGKGYPTLAPKRAETAMIYTMNVKEPLFEEKFINGGGGPLAAFETSSAASLRSRSASAHSTRRNSLTTRNTTPTAGTRRKRNMAGRRISEGAGGRARGGASHGGKDKGEGLAARAEGATFFERVYEIVARDTARPRRQLRTDSLYARRTARGAPGRLGRCAAAQTICRGSAS